jgi:hypothetical protein
MGILAFVLVAKLVIATKMAYASMFTKQKPPELVAKVGFTQKEQGFTLTLLY